jgi:hypothetical protein
MEVNVRNVRTHGSRESIPGLPLFAAVHRGTRYELVCFDDGWYGIAADGSLIPPRWAWDEFNTCFRTFMRLSAEPSAMLTGPAQQEAGAATSTETTAGEGDDDTRHIVRLDIDEQATAGFLAAARRADMTSVAAASKLVEWLAAQEPGVQAAILGQYPQEIEADIARMLLQKMAGRDAAMAAAAAAPVDTPAHTPGEPPVAEQVVEVVLTINV